MQPKTQSSNLKLIGLVGNAGVGKDTVASYLRNVALVNCYVMSFAMPVKRVCKALFNLSAEHFLDSALKEIVHPTWGVSPRQMAQFVGTEIGRMFLQQLLPANKDDHWIKLFDSSLTEIAEDDVADYVVVSDVRFQNEVDYILGKSGIIIHVSRDGKTGDVGIENHPSEQINSLDFSTAETRGVYYEVKNNGTLLDLYEKVDDVLSAAL